MRRKKKIKKQAGFLQEIQLCGSGLCETCTCSAGCEGRCWLLASLLDTGADGVCSPKDESSGSSVPLDFLGPADYQEAELVLGESEELYETIGGFRDVL